MERSKYFNYTRPTATQLNYTEDSRARSVLRRTDSACQPGIVSGFIVTVNGGDKTLVDIGVGTGYTGGRYPSLDVSGDDSGERISTIISGTTDTTGIALALYTLGVKNYISLVYAETESNPLTEIFYPFNSYDTEVEEGFTVSVMTEANWNLLSVAQKRERILIAIVTAKGVGVALTSADIQQVVQPLNHPTPSAPINVTGTTFTGIAPTTPLGTGTLRYVSATQQLFWTAPGDTEGTGVSVSSSGVYTVYSNDTAYWVKITVVYAALPGADISDSISISSLYGKTIPRFSAKDTLHRDMLGTGTPSVTNPHGLSLSDLNGGTLEHADLYHKNGISCDADKSALGQLSCAIVANHIEIVNLGGYTNSFLIDGQSYETLTGYAAGSPGVILFDDALASADYLIYVDSAGVPQRVQIADYTPGGMADYQVLFSANIEILDMHNTLAGLCTLTWDSVASTLRYACPVAAAGTPVKVMKDNFGGGGVHSGIYKVYASDNVDYIIVSVTGDLGGSTSSTFTSNLVDADISGHDETLLKLAVVTFNTIANTLSNVRDIRQFATSDIKDAVYEEHDDHGRHTKVIPRQFRVNASTGAIMAEASSTAIHASAISNALMAYASDAAAAVCSAPSTGIYATASNVGVWGQATTYGLYGRATTYGIFGTAASYGVAGKATTYGAFGEATSYGVYGSAKQLAGYFTAATSTADTVTALMGEARNTNAAATDNAIGVRGLAGNSSEGTGVVGRGKTGGYFSGPTVGVSGAGTFGVAGSGGQTGGSFLGLAALGGNVVGAYGFAQNTSAASSAYATGIYGVAGSSTTGTGVIGLGEIGGVFRGRGNTAQTVTGLYGSAINSSSSNNAIGVYGVVNVGETGTGILGKGLTGVVGSAIDLHIPALGVGGYFNGLSCGVYATGSSMAICGVADNSTSGTGVVGYGETGGYYVAVNDGVYAFGNNCGVFGSADDCALAGAAAHTFLSGYASTYFLKWGGYTASCSVVTGAASCLYVLIGANTWAIPLFTKP